MDIQGLSRDVYPRGIDAFIVDVTGRCRDRKSKGGYGLEVALTDQRAFVEANGFSVPVLEMDLVADYPFQVPA